MEYRKVTSPSNDLLRCVRRAYSGSRTQSQAVVDGIQPVTILLQTHPEWVTDVLIDIQSMLGHPFMTLIRDVATRFNLTITDVRSDLLNSASKQDGRVRVVALFNAPNIEDLSSRFFHSSNQPNQSVALCRIANPGNLGSIMRTMSAVSSDGRLVLIGHCVDPWSPRVIKASMGAVFELRIARCSTVSQLANSCADAMPRRILVAASGHDAIPGRPPLHDQVVWLFGSEREGLSEGDLAECQDIVSLPMENSVESLNVSVAAAAITYFWKLAHDCP